MRVTLSASPSCLGPPDAMIWVFSSTGPFPDVVSESPFGRRGEYIGRALVEHFLLALISTEIEMLGASQSVSVEFTVGFETAMIPTSILIFKQDPPSPTAQSTTYARSMSGCMCLHCRRTPSGL